MVKQLGNTHRQSKDARTLRQRSAALLAMAAVAAAASATGTATATTYTYKPVANTAPGDNWSTGSNWSPSAPASSSTGTIIVIGSNSTTFASGFSNTNTDNFSGAFNMAGFQLDGTGPSSGTNAATITVAAGTGSYLAVTGNGSYTANDFQLNANAGTAGLNYIVSAPITLLPASTQTSTATTTMNGTGTANFTFTGGITADSLFEEQALSTVTLGGTATSTFQTLQTRPAHGATSAGELNLDANVNVSNVYAGFTGQGGGLSVNKSTVTQGNNAVVNIGLVGSTTNTAHSASISGTAADPGIYNLDSGTLNINVGTSYDGLQVAFGYPNVAVLNVSGGTLNNYSTYIGNALQTSDVLGVLQVAAGYGGATPGGSTGTVNQSGGVVNTGTVEMVDQASSTDPGVGTYNLDGGVLSTGKVYAGDTATTATSTFNFNGGTLEANASNTAFMQGLNAANVQAGGAIVNTNGFNDTIGQVLLNASTTGGLTKEGLGTLTLSGANTYAGTTAIADGTLALSVANAVADSSAIDVQSGATLDVSALTSGFSVGAGQTLEGIGTVSTGGHTLTIDGTVSPGDAAMGTLTIDPASMVFGPSSDLSIDAVGAANDTLAVDGNLSLSSGDTLNFLGTPTASLYTIVTYTGTLTGTFTNLNLQGYTVNYGTGSNSSITLSRVPEPATLGLMAVGGLGILMVGRRRKPSAN